MQFKLATLTLALATLAAATPLSRTGGGVAPGDCTTAPIQCCDSTAVASDKAVGTLLGLLGVVLQDLNVIVGLTCSPVTVIGVENGACSATPVCCEDNSHGGLISIGCVPIIL